jgi:hypothetical protein
MRVLLVDEVDLFQKSEGQKRINGQQNQQHTGNAKKWQSDHEHLAGFGPSDGRRHKKAQTHGR